MPSQDYEEFIAALNAHGVRYLVVGAHAVAFHARPRATKDLDILIEPTPADRGDILEVIGAHAEWILAVRWKTAMALSLLKLFPHTFPPCCLKKCSTCLRKR